MGLFDKLKDVINSIDKEKIEALFPSTSNMPVMTAIGEEQLREFTLILREYNSGLHLTKERIISSENWWKLRNTREEQKETNVGRDGAFAARSAWLHNVIVSKHADAMEAFPEPIFLPREASDREEAKMLSAVVPCILDENGFEQVYSDAQWQKCKTGTGAYKVTGYSDFHTEFTGDYGSLRLLYFTIRYEEPNYSIDDK